MVSYTFEQQSAHEHALTDPHRPVYHFLPQANWINDPNGLIQWHGEYHLFYQHNPNGAFWGDMHWGHSVSSDLVHWRHLPIALAPTPNGYDKDGVFSGTAVNNDGIPTIMYTGVSPECQCLATSDDELMTWKKYEGNPVLPAPPAGMEVTGFRDPRVWRQDDRWYMIIGSGFKGVGGTALLYSSPDLLHWEYLHPICIGDFETYGDMWECPDLFPLDGQHVLLFADYKHTVYQIGTFAELKFTQQSAGITDGGHFYAAQSMLDEQGRRLLFGWVTEGRPREEHEAAGWACAMSLPRVLSIRNDGLLGMEPAAELTALRSNHQHIGPLTILPDIRHVLPTLQGDSLELSVEIDPCSAEEIGVAVRQSPDEEEQTIISYNRTSGELTIDRAKSSLSASVQHTPLSAPLKLADGELLQLRVFIDHSIIEVFANGRACVVGRMYPTRDDSNGINLVAHNGQGALCSLDAWTIASIW
jgi:beta-fructofuranosidase